MSDPRAQAYDLVDNGLVSAEAMLQACLSYMSWDEVQDMLECNDCVEAEDEEYDGQPTEQEEWASFDPDC